MEIARRQALVGAGAMALTACVTQSAGASRAVMAGPLVIAHRGASGDRPEHTLGAYRLAIAQGADFIEPDLVISQDGVLICRHENELSESTDVSARPDFAARRRVKTVDGQETQGWFAEDFTLAELKTLRCKERIARLRPDNAAFDGREAIPTFEEVIDLAAAESARLGRVIGVYPETKHPSHHRALGLALEPPLVALLKAKGMNRADAPVFVQSFETGNLKALRREIAVPLVQLVAEDGMPFDHQHTSIGLTYAMMISGDGLKRLAEYAAGIGPQKSLIVPRDGAGRSLAPTDLIARAHGLGLKVHPWTFRAENYFLPLERRRGPDPTQQGDALGELMQFKALGVDGWFADHPGLAAIARATPV
jgi:glycerophosphoryl diester phosphodiesterase